jgi:hypothetical protein
VILLLSTVIAGLIAWVAVAFGVSVALGRMCARRDEQVCADASLPPGVPEQAGSGRSSADAVERSGS